MSETKEDLKTKAKEITDAYLLQEREYEQNIIDGANPLNDTTVEYYHTVIDVENRDPSVIGEYAAIEDILVKRMFALDFFDLIAASNRAANLRALDYTDYFNKQQVEFDYEAQLRAAEGANMEVVAEKV